MKLFLGEMKRVISLKVAFSAKHGLSLKCLELSQVSQKSQYAGNHSFWVLDYLFALEALTSWNLGLT